MVVRGRVERAEVIWDDIGPDVCYAGLASRSLTVELTAEEGWVLEG